MLSMEYMLSTLVVATNFHCPVHAQPNKPLEPRLGPPRLPRHRWQLHRRPGGSRHIPSRPSICPAPRVIHTTHLVITKSCQHINLCLRIVPSNPPEPSFVHFKPAQSRGL